jgi:putative membrane protein
MFLWIKVVHILAVISWMAGLFYLPRLFVYHTDRTVGSEADDLFKLMERRLLRGIMWPALLATWVSGYFMVETSGFSWGDDWLILKLAGVLAMTVFHMVLGRYRRLLSEGWRGQSNTFFRVLNEIPTLLLIWIVIFVVVKPV